MPLATFVSTVETLTPGAVYWRRCWARPGSCWANCPGYHLVAVLPNGIPWDMDSRASNCSMRADRTHRCWVRWGEVGRLTVGRNLDGSLPTKASPERSDPWTACYPPAGSIWVHGHPEAPGYPGSGLAPYHGYLLAGAFTLSTE